MRDVVGVIRVSGGAEAAMIGGWVLLVLNERRGVEGGVWSLCPVGSFGVGRGLMVKAFGVIYICL